MNCPRCQAENREGRRFCAKCGASLALTCAACGFSNEPGENFCGGCGQALEVAIAPAPAPKFASPESYTPKHLAEKILTSKSALEGERKQVTVLFADLKGSMELLADRDPEEARKLLDPVLERMMEAVHRYEGTVNQVMGDGIMALFGAPLAHEDHAVRACYAALRMQESVSRYGDEIQRTHGIPVQIRVGLNSGEVVVRSIGNDLHMDYTAVGQTTHLAGRMEQMAKPGSILLTGDTLRLAEGFVQVKPLGPVPVKGLEAPIQVYEITGAGPVRRRLEAAAARGLTRFVGRQTELEALRQASEKARTGHGQVVAVVGEPGVGKSRLFYEFTHSHRTHGWLTLESSSVSYGKATAYLPVLDLLKGYFKIQDRDDHREIREKITGKLLTLDETLKPTLPAFLVLLDVPVEDPHWQALGPPQRRQRTLDAVKRLLLRESQVQPLCLVFEDLHWIDSETQVVLDSLIESLPTARLLLLVNYRPEYQHGWGSKTYYTQLRIDPLPPESAEELLQGLVGKDAELQPFRQLLIQRTEGNPFFLEESVRALVETQVLVGEHGAYRLAKPVQAIQVPATVQAILAARIDRLTPEDKRLLQSAAVIGENVPLTLLRAVAEAPDDELRSALSRLQTVEFLYETNLFPDLEYTFKHGLTCQVAYASLLAERRKALHRRTASAIEDLYADRLAEQYELLAQHFSRAEEWGKAFEYLVKAGEKMANAFGTREALAFYDGALDAAGRLGEAADLQAVMGVHQAKADLHFILSDFERSRTDGERLLTLARRARDRGSEAVALGKMGRASLWAHDFDGALAYAHQCVEVAEEADAKQVLASGHFVTGFVHAVTGRLDQATEKIDRALRISQSVGDTSNQSFSLYLAGLLKRWEGQYTAASRLLSEGVRVGREHNVLAPLLRCLFGYGITLTCKGDYDEARATIEEGLALSEKVGDEIYRHRLLNSLGWFYIEIGALEHALDLNRRSADGGRKRGDHETIANAEINLGDIFLAKGDLSSAQEILEGVYRLVKDPATSDWMKWRYSTHLFASFAELWLARGDAAKAREFTDQCLEIATPTNSRKYLVKGWRLRGEIALARRQWDDAEAALRQALSIAQAIGNPTQLWKTHVAWGRLHAETKKPDVANQAYRAAREVIDGVKAGLQNAGLRESLERSPLIRQVYDLSPPD